MRIGLYGMPTSGKTFVLDQIDFIEVIVGSRLLREYDPDFDKRDEAGREKDRKDVAQIMMKKETFIMDGHYAFGNEIAFTEEEGKMYEVYIYLYVDPDELRTRMTASEKNQKYLKYNLEEWQNKEIQGLRNYCHNHNKDFYIVDYPPDNKQNDVQLILSFIRDIVDGYSCIAYAQECANTILSNCKTDTISLFDGDKTLTKEDSSNAVFGYMTHLYDGNFYTGYQSWRQKKEFEQYMIPDLKEMPVNINEKAYRYITDDSYILTSGNEKIWGFISNEIQIPFFCGVEMSAETKLYITKILQNSGKKVVAFGDGMNDYYMLRQADESYLITKGDGSVSRSLQGKSLEGMNLV